MHVVLEGIAKLVPIATAKYLVDSWRERLRDIFAAAQETQAVIQPGCAPDIAMVGIRRQIDWFRDIETRVSSIGVPPGRRELHDELLSILARQRSAEEEMLYAAERVDVNGVEAVQQ